jgi:hypothetical protein
MAKRRSLTPMLPGSSFPICQKKAIRFTATPTKAPYSAMETFTAYNGAMYRGASCIFTPRAGMFSGAIQAISVNNQNQNIMKFVVFQYMEEEVILVPGISPGEYHFNEECYNSLGDAFEAAISYVDLQKTKYHTIKDLGVAIMDRAIDVDNDGQQRMDYKVLATLICNYEPK